MNNNPFFSIVMANYNSGRFIERAINSVLSQSCQDFELIIVDGGSKDNSVDIIKKYSDKLAWWVSESDEGQSDAFNKGFAHARGRYYAWLNADDLMIPRTLERVKEYAILYPERQWLAVNTVYIDQSDRVLSCNWLTQYKQIVLRHCLLEDIGPSAFFTAPLFNESGRFDIDNHYTMDEDLWIRFVQLGYRYYRVPIQGWAFRIHELSKTSSSLTGNISEGQRKADIYCKEKNNFKVYLPHRMYQTIKKVFTCLYKRKVLNRKYVGKLFDECGSFD